MTVETVTRTVKLRKVASSIVCTIPQSILDIADLSPGDHVLITGDSDGIVIRKADNRQVTMAEKWKLHGGGAK